MTPEQFHELWQFPIKFHRSKLRQLTLGMVASLDSVVPNRVKRDLDPSEFGLLKKLYQKLFQEFVSDDSVEKLRWTNPPKYMLAWASFLEEHEQQVMGSMGIVRGGYR